MMLCMSRNSLLLILLGQICANSPSVKICRIIRVFSTSVVDGVRILEVSSVSIA